MAFQIKTWLTDHEVKSFQIIYLFLLCSLNSLCFTQMWGGSLSESPEEEEKDMDSPGPLRSDGQPRTLLQEPLSPDVDDSLACPRKRTQTLPTFNCPLTGMAAKAEALNRWSCKQESVEEKSGTFSEDIFKILDLRSSGSFFGGSQMSSKDKVDRLAARRGSDNTSTAAGSQTAESNSHPVRVLAHQRSADALTGSSSVQQLNKRPEPKEDQQQLLTT